MIKSFGDQTTEDIFHGLNTKQSRRLPMNLHKVAGRKLDQIDAAHFLEDLKILPGNGLESLVGNLKGFHSIRINDQWRVVFKWMGSDAEEVKIMDYH